MSPTFSLGLGVRIAQSAEPAHADSTRLAHPKIAFPFAVALAALDNDVDRLMERRRYLRSRRVAGTP